MGEPLRDISGTSTRVLSLQWRETAGYAKFHIGPFRVSPPENYVIQPTLGFILQALMTRTTGANRSPEGDVIPGV